MSKGSKFLRFLGIVFLLLVIVSVFEVINEDEPTQPDSSPEVTVEKGDVEAEGEPAPEPVQEEPTLPTLSEYDAIKKGMTRDQVEMLLGTVEIDFESETDFGDYVSTAVTYKAEGDFGANIMVMYADGEVQTKSNFGMQ